MRALVIYESMFGNTKAIALAVADGIRQTAEVETFEVSEAPTALPPDIELLVVGGPTHAHGMTNANTRHTATERAGIRVVSRGAGIREWLDALVPGRSHLRAAAFDTRIKGPELIWGSAAKGATRRLRALDLTVLPPASFVIGGPGGEPFDRVSGDELLRATAWGAGLAAAIGAATPVAAR